MTVKTLETADKRAIMIAEMKVYMAVHGIFKLLQYKSGMFQPYPTYCECRGGKVSGMLFFKWVKIGRSKKFERLIIHIVCFKCGQKGPIEVFDPLNYNPTTRDNKLWRRFKLKVNVFPK